jgi:hypothetical protein
MRTGVDDDIVVGTRAELVGAKEERDGARREIATAKALLRRIAKEVMR